MAGQLMAAVDIGGTKTTASLCGPEEVLARVYQATRKHGDEATIPRQVDFLVGEACRRAGVPRSRVEALGISTASPFERREGRLVVVSPNICGGLARPRQLTPNDWTGIPLQERLEGRYPTLRIGNDCITAAVAERSFGAGRGEDDLVYVTWSTGIGAGAFVDGHLLTGKNANAMHLGHTIMSWDFTGQPQCGCGGFAHLEALVAGPAIEREYGSSPRLAFERFRAGEPRAQEVVRRTAMIMARGLFNVVSLLDSRLIIVGGSVAKNWDVLEPLVSAEFFTGFAALTQGVEFRRSQLDEYLGELAGLSLVLPESWVESWRRRRPWEGGPQTVVLEDAVGEEGDGP